MAAFAALDWVVLKTTPLRELAEVIPVSEAMVGKVEKFDFVGGREFRLGLPSSSVNRVSDCYCYGWMAKNMTTTVVRGQVWAGSWRQRDRVDPEWFC